MLELGLFSLAIGLRPRPAFVLGTSQDPLSFEARMGDELFAFWSGVASRPKGRPSDDVPGSPGDEDSCRN
jgi:hypothetical protein